MCQLLGMNAASPTSFSFCFKGFCHRGGDTDKHKDGWGLAIYEGRGLRSFLDVKACSKSPVAKFVEAYPTRTQNMIAHVRCATHGKVGLENVHPFNREMWGIPWCFAHNGEVPACAEQHIGHHIKLGKVLTESQMVYHAIGDTDSEAVFCALLNALRAEFHTLPMLPVLYKTLSRLLNELFEIHQFMHGADKPFINNFLLGCGPYTLFAYSWPGQVPGSAVWNGLYYLLHEPNMSVIARLVDEPDYSMTFDTTSTDHSAIIATKPLTDENGWIEMMPGQLILFDRGVPHMTASDVEEVERRGHGLSSRCFLKEGPT